MNRWPASGPRRHCLQRLAGLLALACVPGRSGAADAAPSLCGSTPPPPCPPPDKPALVQSWLLDGRQDGPLPDCSGLRARDFELMVHVAGSYPAPGELADQLARFGLVSRLKGMGYWSYTERRRQPLIREAFAVDQLASLQQRPDFSLDELRSGRELCFVQSDNRSSALVPYALQLLQATADAFQLRIENAADIRFMGLTLVAARELQWVVTLERQGSGRWGYRSLVGVRRLRLGRGEQHRLSNLSRCVALFDLMASRQTEIEAYR